MNSELFWKLLEPEHPRAGAFCRRLTGRDDGDDLYQDALIAAMDKFDTLRDHGAFRPWLYRIIVNRFRNRCRSPWWQKRLHKSDDWENGGEFDPTEQYTARRWLKRAFGALKADEKALIILFELEGWSIAELSRLRKQPQGTIKAKLSRSRRKMRKAIAAFLKDPKKTEKMCEADYALSRSSTATE